MILPHSAWSWRSRWEGSIHWSHSSRSISHSHTTASWPHRGWWSIHHSSADSTSSISITTVFMGIQIIKIMRIVWIINSLYWGLNKNSKKIMLKYILLNITKIIKFCKIKVAINYPYFTYLLNALFSCKRDHHIFYRKSL